MVSQLRCFSWDWLILILLSCSGSLPLRCRAAHSAGSAIKASDSGASGQHLLLGDRSERWLTISHDGSFEASAVHGAVQMMKDEDDLLADASPKLMRRHPRDARSESSGDLVPPNHGGGAFLDEGKPPMPEAVTINEADKVLKAEGKGLLKAGKKGDGEEPYKYLNCSTSYFAPLEKCPKDCAFLLEDVEKPCNFRCVPASDCGLGGSTDVIPDNNTMFCRPCRIAGCDQCGVKDGFEWCSKCKPGRELITEGEGVGQCQNRTAENREFSLLVIFGLIFLVFGGAYGYLYTRLACNEHTLDLALQHREQLKVRDNRYEQRPPFPRSVNVHEDTTVAGMGFVLHMDFQVFLAIWAFLAILAWAIFVQGIYPRAFTIGVQDDSDPRHICRAVSVGSTLWTRFRHSKLLFTATMYLTTFVMCLLFALRQNLKSKRLFADDHMLMKFAAKLSGFPLEVGAATLEEDYEDFIKQFAPSSFVGVSICWDRMAKSKEVSEFIKREQDLRFVAFENSLELHNVPPPDEPQPQDPQFVEALLRTLPTSGVCYAVFQTEEARDKAVRKINEAAAPKFRDKHVISAKEAAAEPHGVIWESFGSHSPLFFRGVAAAAFVALAIVLWALVVYGPYAYYQYVNFASAGREPDSAVATSFFTLLVVAGNLMVYTLCDYVSHRMSLQTVDKRQAVYIVTYTIATFFNMILDVGLLIYTQYLGMIVQGVRDDNGRLLSDMTTFEEVMTSFPMQKFAGKKLYQYNIYGCFLVPFILEPIFTILLPSHLAVLYVRSRPVPFRAAVEMFSVPMDLGRYADFLMNMSLAAAALMFSSGWVLANFIGLLASFVFCYMLDRHRVLNYIDWFCYPTDFCDQVAQRVMALPCAVLATVVAFQMRTVNEYRAEELAAMMAVGFFGHILLHQLCLSYLYGLSNKRVPKLMSKKSAQTYDEVKLKQRLDWFNANQVHCLRTKYVLKWPQPPRLPEEPVNLFAPGEVWQRRRDIEATNIEKVSSQQPATSEHLTTTPDAAAAEESAEKQ
eukprot:TRINITY_DN59284_c0_g2_i1.p1 TRINITY_DN59284_c0_g2~~TRINITY_DN59284_c0_g2_i1.p1  ORF type:complete len:1020 (-),score=198.58 TRINITY_DN59284_c0_g2_i1:2-3061(-)